MKVRFKATIELKKANELGYFTNAHKEFSARSFLDAVKKIEKNLLKLGLHRDGDYIILDIKKV